MNSLYLYAADGDFIMNGRYFHDGRSRFYYKRLIFAWWQIENLWWTVKIFIITLLRFYDERLRVSWSQVGNVMMTGEICIMNSREFHLTEKTTGNLSGGNCPVHNSAGQYSQDWLHAILFKLYSTQFHMFLTQFSPRRDIVTYPKIVWTVLALLGKEKERASSASL